MDDMQTSSDDMGSDKERPMPAYPGNTCIFGVSKGKQPIPKYTSCSDAFTESDGNGDGAGDKPDTRAAACTVDTMCYPCKLVVLGFFDQHPGLKQCARDDVFASLIANKAVKKPAMCRHVITRHTRSAEAIEKFLMSRDYGNLEDHVDNCADTCSL